MMCYFFSRMEHASLIASETSISSSLLNFFKTISSSGESKELLIPILNLLKFFVPNNSMIDLIPLCPAEPLFLREPLFLFFTGIYFKSEKFTLDTKEAIKI